MTMFNLKSFWFFFLGSGSELQQAGNPPKNGPEVGPVVKNPCSNITPMKTDEMLPLPYDVKTDDPLCSGKKSQPPDVAVDVL